jgi:hypothetical protein
MGKRLRRRGWVPLCGWRLDESRGASGRGGDGDGEGVTGAGIEKEAHWVGLPEIELLAQKGHSSVVAGYTWWKFGDAPGLNCPLAGPGFCGGSANRCQPSYDPQQSRSLQLGRNRQVDASIGSRLKNDTN